MILTLTLSILACADNGPAINLTFSDDTAGEDTATDDSGGTDSGHEPADADADTDADSDADADADADSDTDSDSDSDADADSDADSDSDSDADSDADIGELCWYPDASGDDAEQCSTRVDDEDVREPTCDLDQPVDNGELWVMDEGWTSNPIDSSEGEFSSLCGDVEVVDGWTQQVNAEFYGDFSGSNAEIPDTYSGQWWACGNWYGELAHTGTFTWNGSAVSVADIEVQSLGGGIDCYMEIWVSN